MTHDIPSQQVEVERIFDVLWPLSDWNGEEAVCRAAARAVIAVLAPKPEGETVTDDGWQDRTADEAVDFVFDRLAKKLGLAEWQVVEGSEEWEGDVSATLHRLLIDAGIIDDETGAIATLAASPKPTAVTVPDDGVEDEARSNAWNDFFSDHLTDGNDGYRAAAVIDRCRTAFDAAWTGGRGPAFTAALAALTPKPTPVEASGMVEPDAPALIEWVTELARRDVRREMTDFVGRMHECMGTFEDICDQHPDGDWPEDARDEGGEALAGLAGLALAQLAMVSNPAAPLASLSASSPSSEQGGG